MYYISSLTHSLMIAALVNYYGLLQHRCRLCVLKQKMILFRQIYNKLQCCIISNKLFIIHAMLFFVIEINMHTHTHTRMRMQTYTRDV